MPSKTDAVSIIAAAFEPLAGKQILDIGCGNGALARSLSARGARLVGVDPNGEALEVARQAVPRATFHQAPAEAMPFADRCFDGAVFLNSLHHVPEFVMEHALREAARVVRPEGPLVIIEPLAEGSSFSVLRLVEDETDLRAAAQETIDGSLESGTFESLSLIDYVRREHYTDLEQFLVRIAAVDPARAVAIEEHRPEIEATFQRYARVDKDGRMLLEQPMRAQVLTFRT